MTASNPDFKRYNITIDKYYHPVSYETEHGQWVKYSSYKALQAECEKLHSLLRKCQPIMRAHAGATHMLDGFRPKRNQWDELADRIDLALLDYRKQRAQQ